MLVELSLAPDLPATDRRSGIDRSVAKNPVRQQRDRDRPQRRHGVTAVAASFTSPLTGAPNRGIRIEGDPPFPPRVISRMRTSR